MLSNFCREDRESILGSGMVGLACTQLSQLMISLIRLRHPTALAKDTILRGELKGDCTLNEHISCWDPFTESKASLTFNVQLERSQGALVDQR